MAARAVLLVVGGRIGIGIFGEPGWFGSLNGSASTRVPSLTVTRFSASPRTIFSFTVVPGLRLLTASARALASATGLPSSATIRSPAISPAFSAGEPTISSATSTPPASVFASTTPR